MKLKILFLILVIVNVSLTIAAPEIKYPTNNYLNSSDYTVTWSSVTGANCYQLYEIESNLPFYYSTNSSDELSRADNTYTYKVRASSDSCGPHAQWSDTWSTPAFIIVDTTPPTVVSKSPSGNNEPLSDNNIVIGFSESMNTSTLTLVNDSGSISFDFGSATWGDGNTNVSIPYTATNEGDNVVVNISAKDLAGNQVKDSLQFTTLVKPTTVTISSPSSSDSIIQGDSITFTVSVNGVKMVFNGVIV